MQKNSSQSSNLSLLGVVLNGGKSRRMGCDKSTLATRDGSIFLDLATRRFDGVCGKLVLSVGADKTTVETSEALKIVRDRQVGCGPLGGISSCMNHALAHGFEACFFTPIDMPFLTRKHLLHLRDEWTKSPGRIACAFNESRSSIEPLFSIIPTSFHQAIEQSIYSSRLSVEGWITEHRPLSVPIDASALRNINRPKDYVGIRPTNAQ